MPRGKKGDEMGDDGRFETTAELRAMREALEWVFERAQTESNTTDPQRLRMALATIEQSARETLSKFMRP
jgi:hypothetical protein